MGSLPALIARPRAFAPSSPMAFFLRWMRVSVVLSKRSSERSMSSASPKNMSIERTCVEARGAVVSTRMQGSWRISSNQERTS